MIKTRYALEFLSVWEEINNSNFKVVESDHFNLERSPPSTPPHFDRLSINKKGRFMKITELKTFS
jgi:hypothetical protein